jgi:serine/threonine protein kinase
MSLNDSYFEAIAETLCVAKGWTVSGFSGGGVFKQVYRAQVKPNEFVAIKIVKGKSPRTTREIEAIGRCTHPNIAKMYEAGRISHIGAEYDYTVEEFLAGGTLADRISAGKLTREAIITVGEALINALSHLFPLRIVHRDIKPANIMFRDREDIPVLVDFGLVRNLSDSSLTESWLPMGPGTPFFASPEQLNNEKELIDWRSDEFNLGVVLSVAHLGMHPFQTEGPVDTDQTVHRVAERGPWHRDFARLCTDARVSSIMRMVERWPVQRFRTPSDLLEAWRSQG